MCNPSLRGMYDVRSVMYFCSFLVLVICAHFTFLESSSLTIRWQSCPITQDIGVVQQGMYHIHFPGLKRWNLQKGINIWDQPAVIESDWTTSKLFIEQVEKGDRYQSIWIRFSKWIKSTNDVSSWVPKWMLSAGRHLMPSFSWGDFGATIRLVRLDLSLLHPHWRHQLWKSNLKIRYLSHDNVARLRKEDKKLWSERKVKY